MRAGRRNGKLPQPISAFKTSSTLLNIFLRNKSLFAKSIVFRRCTVFVSLKLQSFFFVSSQGPKLSMWYENSFCQLTVLKCMGNAVHVQWHQTLNLKSWSWSKKAGSSVMTYRSRAMLRNVILNDCALNQIPEPTKLVFSAVPLSFVWRSHRNQIFYVITEPSASLLWPALRFYC